MEPWAEYCNRPAPAARDEVARSKGRTKLVLSALKPLAPASFRTTPTFFSLFAQSEAAA